MFDFTPLLAIGIPSVISLVGVIWGAAWLRKSNKESNDNSAFKTITDQLFRDNADLREQLGAVKTRVTELESNKRDNERRIGHLEDELRDSKEANGRLARYVKKLIRLWPSGTSLPEPDEGIDWESHS